jgi:hypothetical protein
MWPDFTQDFLNSILKKSDEELVELLSQQFICEGQEDEPMTIDDIAFNEDTTFIDDADFKRGYGFQVLALLAATKKEKTFGLVRDHFIKGKSVNGFDGYIKYLQPDDPSFDSKEDEMAIRANPKWVFITKKDEFGGPDQEEVFMFKSCSFSASDFDEDNSINISELGYEYLTERMKLENGEATITLPRDLFGGNFPSQSIVDNSTHITKDEFGEVPANTGDVVITIELDRIEL